MKSKQTIIVAFLALTAAWTGFGEEPQRAHKRDRYATTNEWRVQVGWVHQWGHGMSVRGPAPSLMLGSRPALSGAAGLTYPDNSSPVARQFDDGYVRPDIWTGDAGVPGDRRGMTWNWGANNPSQYNYDDGIHPTLTFHKDRGEYVGGAYSVSSTKSDDDPSTEGIEVKASRLLYSWTDGSGASNGPNPKVILDVSWIFGLAYFPSTQQKSRRTAGQDVYNLSETYTYSDYYGTAAGGSYPPLQLPYSGTAGSVGGSDAGPLIPVTPESSALGAAYAGSLRDTVEIKSKLWRLRGETGVEFAKPLTDRLDVYVAPQIVLEFIDLSAKRNETVTSGSAGTAVASRSDSAHKMTVMPGALLTAGADYRFNEDWYAGASVGWEWLVDDPSMRVGSDRIKYDLDGGEFSLYIGRRF